jgi:WD40 repeat protein
LLVTTAGTEQARIWNLSDPTKPLEVLDARHGSMCNPNKASLNSYTAGFDSAVFSRDRTHVATSDYDRSACVWTLAGKTYRPTLFIREPPGATNGIGIYEGGSAPVRWADISPDGKRLLIASEDGTARILSMADRAALRVLADPTGQPINDAWFSHDGQLVVTASNGGTVGIWNASTGVEEQQIVEPDRSQVYNAAFSPDDTLVVTCGGTAHIFRIKDSRGSLLQNPQRLTDFQYGGDISDCEFSPNGTLIATGGQQGNTRIFSTELDGSLQYVEALARARVSRQLTAAEKKQYGIS